MDGDTTVRYLQSYIRAKDYHPELAKDYYLKLSEEVGELARALRPDVITLDVVMPRVDGWTVLQHVKSDPELSRIPVVLCSSRRISWLVAVAVKV